MMKNLLVRLIGWKATVLHGDPSTYDRWKWLERHLQRGPLRTLEAGCGSGAFIMYAARMGNHSIGISNSKSHNDAARNRAQLLRLSNIDFLEIDLRNLDEWKNKLGKFDQIICFETIEHLLNDKKLIEDLSELLSPGGRLFLTAPYKHHERLLDETTSQVEDGGHVRYGYLHKELSQLLAESGLQVLREEYISGYVTQQLMNLMRILSRFNYVFAWALTAPLRILGFLDRPLTNGINYPYLSVGVVASKPKLPLPAASRGVQTARN
jgi:2-polyprenyl-3-methyl-5-hydroxy-6-metoxy-1,4-benzoquinol methylase